MLPLTKLALKIRSHALELNLASLAAYFVIISITVTAFWGLIGFNGAAFTLDLLNDNYIQKIISFTLYQALLSTFLSLLIALPVARALHRINPVGRNLFLRLSLLAFVMPTLVLISGLVNLLGPQSWLASNFSQWNLFGLNGILLAHVYLNFPFAVRVLYSAYQAIPESREQLGSQLKLTTWQRIRHIEWPALQAHVWTLVGLIGILCFNSFAVVLTLGGGPKATTIELAIYQALKYDFNLSEGLTLAWVQFAIAGVLFLALSYGAKVNWLGANRAKPATHQEIGLTCFIQWPMYLFAWAYLLLPLAALLSKLNFELIAAYPYLAMIKALAVSIVIALSAAVMALVLALTLLTPIRSAAFRRERWKQAVFNWLASHTLVAPAMVLSTGTYVLLISNGLLETFNWAYLIALNTVVVLPFIINQLKPHCNQFDQQYELLSQNLKLSLRERLSISTSYLKRPMVVAFSLALLLTLGDVSIFAIFGSYEHPTLPWLIYTFAGTYRLAEAALTSIILLAICFALLSLMEHYSRDE